jgi:glycosyltransferase involved in cell wall biosynthesis
MALSEKASNGEVVFMFAGNMGVPQNLENVIDGFLRAAMKDAELWLVGGGVMAEPLQKKYGEKEGVKFCGRQPRAEMPGWFAKADVLIISLTDRYSLTLPGKFQSYIKTGKPLLGILNGEARELIEEFKIGHVANPGDVDEIAASFQRMREACASGEGAAFGERAKRLSSSMFDRDKLIARLWEASDDA